MKRIFNSLNNLKTYLILLFIISFGIFYYIHILDRENRINLELTNKLHDLKIHYSLTLDYFYTDAQSLQQKVLNDSKIINLVANSYNKSLKEQAVNRKQLYNYLLPFYKRIQTRGILQFQFMFLDNTTFLRMHKPQKFGDDLTDIRYSYKYTNETKKVSFGFEQGRTVHGIRYVFPLFDKNQNHIGAAEVALSTKYMQERLITSNKIHTHYIVNKKIFEVKAWEEPGMVTKYIQSVEHDDYMYTITSHLNKKLREKEKKYIKGIKKQINQKIKTNKPFSVYAPTDDGVKVISFFPIKNIKDKKVVAYIVSHTNNPIIKSILQDSKIILIMTFLLLIIFFYFIYHILNHREILKKEVDKKTKELRILNQNLEKRVQKELEKNKKAQEQIYKSEKMAALGEMIGNIAHQWRQPLSVISTAISGLKIEQEYGKLTEDKINNAYHVINENAQYLSKTIDDFRDFIKENRVKKKFLLNETFNSFFHLIEGSIKNHNLNVIFDIKEEISIDGYPNELTQCFLNIFNNAKDAQLNQDKNRFIYICASTTQKNVIISFKDNGGGISQDILPRIFEPYFTTKHKSQGTGLGLSITYNLITHGMNGSIEATNITYTHENQTFNGVEIKLTLPLK